MNENYHTQPRTKIRIPHPTGLLRLVMRIPIFLYRIRLGRLLGKRFLLLEHRGRKSGAIRGAVIEVVDYDPKMGSFIVAAAWDKQSDWYKNITQRPTVTIEVGSKRFSAIARILPKDKAIQALSAYSEKHPSAFRWLGSLLIGSTPDAPDKIVMSLVEAIPLVQLTPKWLVSLILILMLPKTAADGGESAP